MNLYTQALHAGYTPKNGEARVLPIQQSTTFVYEKTKDVQALFDLEAPGFFYSRLANPTVDAVEKKIAALEGGVAAMCTSSGQAAAFSIILTLAKAGDHIVSSSSIYGGTFNLFAVTLKRMGIEVSFVNQDASTEEIKAAFRPNTKALFAETIANPGMNVLDIERFATIAHSFEVPLVVDNTFATPFLCRPIDFGADIVMHSTTKYMDGHAVQVGGVVVDSGKFDFTKSSRFEEFNTPDPSYHGLIYTQAFANMAFIVKARVQIMRDIGLCMTAQAAFYLNQGLETLGLRMERHCENALKVAKFLKQHSKVSAVRFCALEDSPYYDLAKKYLNGKGSGVISFEVVGGREGGIRFIDNLKLCSLQVHVADIRTCVLHPASSTHRQLSDEQLQQANITAGLVRLSVGLEDLNDIIADLDKALSFV